MQQLMEAGAACVAARSLLAASARHILAQRNTTTTIPTDTNGHHQQQHEQHEEGRTESPYLHINNNDNVSKTAHISSWATSPPAAAADAAIVSVLTWRYLEMGVRGTVCVEALRRTAREMAAGNSGRARGGRQEQGKGGRGRGKGEGGGGGSGGGAAEQVEEAASRLEEGLATGEMGDWF